MESQSYYGSRSRSVYTPKLSQRQRKQVLIVQIFLREKKTYLLDETTSNFDPKVSKENKEHVLNPAR